MNQHSYIALDSMLDVPAAQAVCEITNGMERGKAIRDICCLLRKEMLDLAHLRFLT